MIALLALPVIIKLARAVINIFYLVQWHSHSSISPVDSRALTVCAIWSVQSSWILELLDNTYISALFLLRLGSHVYTSLRLSDSSEGSSQSTFVMKLRTLFWIASTNFVFPLIFGLCQVVLIFTDNAVTAMSIKIVNTYVAIISTVLATIWASTTSYHSSALSRNSFDGAIVPVEPIVFQHRKGHSHSESELSADDSKREEVDNRSNMSMADVLCRVKSAGLAPRSICV